MRSSKGIPLLTVVTVSAFDIDRLSITLNSLIEVSGLNIEHITVLPSDDQESIALWREICGEIPSFHLLHDNNAGIYPAMNLGGMAATGKYLVFWNSGERITSRQEIMSLLSGLDETVSPQVISQGQIEWLPNHEQTIDEYRGFLFGERDRFISHQTYFVQKNLFIDLGGFDCRLRVVADTEFMMRGADRGLEIFSNCMPVFVENSKFASDNQRRARVEDFVMSLKHGVLKKNFTRTAYLLRKEFGAFKCKIFEFLEVSSWRITANIFERSEFQNLNYPSNYSREKILRQFAYQFNKLQPNHSIMRINIVGGTAEDPEAVYLAKRFPNSIITTFGIEGADIYLDLNQTYSQHQEGGDIVLVSQVLEHVWNHQAFFSNIIHLCKDGGFLWLACPASNKLHGSPDFFATGLSHSYLRENLNDFGVEILADGFFGTKRLYLATHWLPGWLSVRAHRFPLLFAFDNRSVLPRTILRVRFAFQLMALSFTSPSETLNQRWATESWILARKR